MNEIRDRSERYAHAELMLKAVSTH